MFLQNLSPDFIKPDILSIDPAELLKLGFRGIILDLDNTIVPWNEEVIEAPVMQWVNSMKEAGFRICLLSNSLYARVNGIAGTLQVDAVPAGIKPRKKAFKKAMHKLQLTPEEIVVIGDQIFTDILGGKRVGLKTILVEPIDRKELIWTRFFRRVEKLILAKVRS